LASSISIKNVGVGKGVRPTVVNRITPSAILFLIQRWLFWAARAASATVGYPIGPLPVIGPPTLPNCASFEFVSVMFEHPSRVKDATENREKLDRQME
jgi:hypothetical protein